jgi:hypothetical protein
VASTKLLERDGIRIKDETLRMGLLDPGEWKKTWKPRRHRRWGQQKQHCGKRVQMAGSYHDWFEERGPRRVLIGYVDDAARDMFGRFYDDEQRCLR